MKEGEKNTDTILLSLSLEILSALFNNWIICKEFEIETIVDNYNVVIITTNLHSGSFRQCLNWKRFMKCCFYLRVLVRDKNYFTINSPLSLLNWHSKMLFMLLVWFFSMRRRLRSRRLENVEVSVISFLWTVNYIHVIGLLQQSHCTKSAMLEGKLIVISTLGR